jgi:hypothetical protein
VVAAILIVYGRVHRRRRWGNAIALAGCSLLAITGFLVLGTRP